MGIFHRAAIADLSAMASAITGANDAAAAAVARVTTIETAPYLRGVTGKATISAAIGVAATVPLAVTYRDSAGNAYVFPNTSYNAIAGLEGDDGLLGNLSCLIKTGSKTTSGCTVSVKNNALISLGLNATVTVVAFYV